MASAAPSPTATITDPDHIPVLLTEVVEGLSPKDGGLYVDGTFGAGGYTVALLKAANCTVWAIDRDPETLARGKVLAESFPAPPPSLARPLWRHCRTAIGPGDQIHRWPGPGFGHQFHAGRRPVAGILFLKGWPPRYAHGKVRYERSRCRKHPARNRSD